MRAHLMAMINFVVNQTVDYALIGTLIKVLLSCYIYCTSRCSALQVTAWPKYVLGTVFFLSNILLQLRLKNHDKKRPHQAFTKNRTNRKIYYNLNRISMYESESHLQRMPSGSESRERSKPIQLGTLSPGAPDYRIAQTDQNINRLTWEVCVGKACLTGF